MDGFGKVFASLYEGSMLGAGVHVFALWPYCLARADAKGRVEVNPRLAAVVLGCSIPEVESALEYLQRPDPDSRSQEEEGRRLVREGQFAFRIVNYARYREMRDKEARREYQREWVKEKRHGGKKSTMIDRRQSRPRSTQAEAEAEAEAEKRGEPAALPRRPSPSALMETWNRERGPLPEARGLSKARERQAKARLEEVPDLYRWGAAIRRAAASPFLQGENDRGWRASFDWLLQGDSLLRIEEGKYDRGAPKVSAGSHPTAPTDPRRREIDGTSPEWVRDAWAAICDTNLRPDVPDDLASAAARWREGEDVEPPERWAEELEAAYAEARKNDKSVNTVRQLFRRSA